MIRNYIKTLLRSFRKDLLYSLVSLGGLVVAFTAVLLIVVFIQFERTFDKHFSAAEDIFLLYSTETGDASKNTPDYMVDLNLSPALQNDVAGVAAVTCFNPYSGDFYVEEGAPMSQSSAQVDSAFFQVFDFRFIAGDPLTALRSRDGIVLSERAAKDYFNTTDVLGESLYTINELGEKTTYMITGVIENVPANTSFEADVFVNTMYRKKAFAWNAKFKLMSKQFIRLEPDLSAEVLDQRMEAFRHKYEIPESTEIGFKPLSDIHFAQDAGLQDDFRTRDIRYLYVFGGIALLILLIACINYVNLCTARSLQRVKEVGIRKTIGARQWQLLLQFVGESFFYFVLALPVAFLFAYWLSPLFFDIFGITLPTIFLFNSKVISSVVAVACLAGLIAGAYPAFFLSRQHPTRIFQRQSTPTGIQFGPRKTLLVAQFGISIFLIAFTIGMQRQTIHLQSRQLGFDSDYLVALPEVQLRQHYAAFKTELKRHKDIIAFTSVLTDIGAQQQQRRTMDSLAGVAVETVVGDFDFTESLGIPLKEGRSFLASSDFERKFDSEFIMYQQLDGASEADIAELKRRRPILVTENLIDTYGLKDPIGTVFENKQGYAYGTIVGVTEDFDFGPQRERSSGKVIYGDYPFFYGGYGYVRISATNIPATLKHIEETWKRFAPQKAFSYHFMDERIQQLYEAEVRLVTLFRAFALLAIGISALGLFSLTALMVKQRRVEIGIRKVMGASVKDISLLFSKDFLKQLVMAFIIAIPLAWWCLHIWLEDYAYRIAISWSIFALSGLAALFIAMLTVNMQAIRAARANPVDSLRDE